MGEGWAYLRYVHVVNATILPRCRLAGLYDAVKGGFSLTDYDI